MSEFSEFKRQVIQFYQEHFIIISITVGVFAII